VPAKAPAAAAPPRGNRQDLAWPGDTPGTVRRAAVTAAAPARGIKRVDYPGDDAAVPPAGPPVGPLVGPPGGPVLGPYDGLPPSGDPACGPDACCPDACCGGACPPCEGDSRCGNRVYGSAEYLLWWIRDSKVPVLATTGPGGAILFGGDSIDNEERSGGRFTAGYWFDCCQTNAIEGSFFFLGERSVNFTSSLPSLARPFFNAATGMVDVEATSVPGALRGTININMPSRLWGAELDWRHNLCCGCWYRVDLLAGFRYVDLKEGLHIMEEVTVLPGATTMFPNFPFPAGTVALLSDRFDTRNQFYGGQVGLDTELRRGRWTLDLTTKVALGDTHQVVDIGGNTAFLPPGGRPMVFTGGLLALSSNIGHFERDRFSVVPEAGVTLGYQLTDAVRLFAGYNFLFWSNVVRPGEQIDPVLNPRLIPNFCKLQPSQCPPNNVTLARPMFQFRETSFWAQGLTAGVELKY
jgi:hypothetical protein